MMVSHWGVNSQGSESRAHPDNDDAQESSLSKSKRGKAGQGLKVKCTSIHPHPPQSYHSSR